MSEAASDGTRQALAEQAYREAINSASPDGAIRREAQRRLVEMRDHQLAH